MLRPLANYPFSSVIDDVVKNHGVDTNIIHQENSVLFNMDVSAVDTSMQTYIQNNFSPQSVDGLSAEQLETENIFDLISPLSSRFCTDRAMRLQFADNMQKYLDTKKQQIENDAHSKEIKDKYDSFIKSLSV